MAVYCLCAKDEIGIQQAFIILSEEGIFNLENHNKIRSVTVNVSEQ